MNRVSVEEVQKRLATDSDHVTVVDARGEEAWNSSDIKGAGAVRVAPDEAEQHVADVNREHFVITYCT